MHTLRDIRKPEQLLLLKISDGAEEEGEQKILQNKKKCIFSEASGMRA